MNIYFGNFVWNRVKESINIRKHGVDFYTATLVFSDQKRQVFKDVRHSIYEERFYCIGNVNGRILTVRFASRSGRIRIFGAGYWRRGVQYYYGEEER